MAKRRGNTFNKKVIGAIINTPFIVVGATKRKRRSAAKKWLDVMLYASNKM